MTIINPKPEKGHGEVADGSDGTGGGMDDPDASSEDDEEYNQINFKGVVIMENLVNI